MTDLISRQAAKEKACSICRWEGTENCAECEHPIDDLPTLDAVPVVRCKDCKYYKEGVVLSPQKFCFRLRGKGGEAIGYNFAEDEFCSFAERSENE